MPLSYQEYTGDGTTTQFVVPFTYIAQDHVKVYVDDVDTAFTWQSVSTLALATAPASGATVRIQRTTPITERLVDFTNASLLTEAVLDLSAEQQFAVVQELKDQVDPLASYRDDAEAARDAALAGVAAAETAEAGAETAEASAQAAQAAAETARDVAVAATTSKADKATVSVLEANVAMTGLRLSSIASLSLQTMVDGIIDEFKDAVGVDAVTSINERYITDHFDNLTYGADLCTGGTASTNSLYADKPPEYAFDDSLSTYWRAAAEDAATVGVYIGYQFTAPVMVGKVRLRTVLTESTNPTAITIQSSNDGTAWTDRAAFVNVPTTADTWNEFDVPGNTAAEYWRVRNDAATGGALVIREIEMLPPVNSAMALHSVDFTADETPTQASLFVLLKLPDGGDINTDVKGWVSNDSGVTQDAVSLSEAVDYGDGLTLFTGDVTLATPASTSLRWIITSHNSTPVEVHGVAMNWR